MEVKDEIHMCTYDEGSNMKKAWKEVEGSDVCVIVSKTAVGGALSIESIKPLLKTLRVFVPISIAPTRYTPFVLIVFH